MLFCFQSVPKSLILNVVSLLTVCFCLQVPAVVSMRQTLEYNNTNIICLQ